MKGKFVDLELIDKKCLDQWQRDAALRAKFNGSFEGYRAYVRADEKGLVKIAQTGAKTFKRGDFS